MGILNMLPTKVESSPDEETEEVTEGKAAGAEETETPDETSDVEQTTENEPEPIEEVSSEKTEEKEPVAVTPEEKKPWDVDALKAERDRVKQELQELRAERRKAREEAKEQDLFVPAAADLSDVAESDVQLVERILQAKGYVKKDDIHRETKAMTYREKLDGTKDSWLKDHPEYLPENDPKDEKWNSLQSTMNEYGFKAPSKPEQIKDLLDFAHQKLNPRASMPVKSKAVVDSSHEKITNSSKASGGVGRSIVTKTKSNVDLSALVGFSDDELKEFTN